jgi:predicted nucleotidyltransferase
LELDQKVDDMPTALELSRKEWQPYLEAAARRTLPPPLSPEERRMKESLMKRVEAAADLLKTRVGARRVVLFGSLAHQAWFAPDSDVDLMVEGLAAGGYWLAWRLAEEIVADRAVDLIELETASLSLLQSIRRHGVEL